MGYNLAKRKMKKILLLFALFGSISVTLFANQPYNPIHLYDETNDGLKVTTVKVTVLSVTSSSMELLVEASDALNDFCNYFDNSWVDVGLTVYCSFAKTGVYGECVIYKAVKALCGINGVVRLSMEGDISSAIKLGLKTGTQVYSIVKQSRTAFTISEAMCVKDY